MGPHAGGPVERAGLAPEDAQAALVMVHGRNAGPRNILSLAEPLAHPGYTYLAPAAAGNTWYPHSFMADTASNEPGLSSGLDVLHALVTGLVGLGLPRERIVLLGFSQGACLAAEYAARHPARFGGVLVFSGGLIGPPGTSWPAAGSLEGTPVFLGCSDVDGHVPETRVRESAEIFTRLGASVTMRIYPDMGHLVNEDELAFARDIMRSVAEGD